VVAGTVRDLIEAGLSELDDAAVAMDLVMVGLMPGVSALGLAQFVYPISATWTTVWRVALRSLLTGHISRDACPGDGWQNVPPYRSTEVLRHHA
jgi:hypothetical protein